MWSFPKGTGPQIGYYLFKLFINPVWLRNDRTKRGNGGGGSMYDGVSSCQKLTSAAFAVWAFSKASCLCTAPPKCRPWCFHEETAQFVSICKQLSSVPNGGEEKKISQELFSAHSFHFGIEVRKRLWEKCKDETFGEPLCRIYWCPGCADC